MAEAPEKPGHPLEVALFLGAILAGLAVLWWARGGPEHAGVQNLFIPHPMPAQQPMPAPSPQY